MDFYCGSPFWNVNQTWNTPDPDFSSCFHQTVLVWIPCFFLWIFAAWETYSLYSNKSQKIPFYWFIHLKMFLILLMLVAVVVDFFDALYLRKDGDKVPDVFLYTPMIKLFTLVMLATLTVVAVKRGHHTSGVIFSFWLLFVVCGTLTFRSNIRNAVRQNDFSLTFVTACVTFISSVGLLLLSCFADITPEIKATLREKKVCPEQYASFISQIWYSWMDNLIWHGFRRELEESDLWDLPENSKTIKICEKFDREWQKEEFKAFVSRSVGSNNHASNITGYERLPSVEVDQKYKKSLGKTVWRTFGGHIMLSVLYEFIGVILGFASPVTLNWLIKFVSSDEPTWHGFMFAMLMSLTTLFESIMNNQNMDISMKLSVRINSAIKSAVYRKALRISSASKQMSTAGEIVNLMSVDAEYVSDVFIQLAKLLVAPIQLGIALYLMWNLLEVSVFIGVVIFVLLIPMNVYLTRNLEKLQTNTMEQNDDRVRVVNEILAGIRVLKMYAWELPFQSRVNQIRDRELGYMRKTVFLNSAVWALNNSAPMIASVAMFGFYILIDSNHHLDASKIFVSLALMNILKEPLSYAPMMITYAVQMRVSLRRINKFLNSEEVDPDQVKHEPRVSAVVMECATFAWSAEGDAILSAISFKIPRGSLVGVVGIVGSGKSSLLSAILGEMEKRDGELNTCGKIAYVAQQAWIRNATLRDNILFGRSLDEDTYNQIVEGCALRPDLAVLPGGDLTEIGEKGINLSGGQKQRVSLARAVYSMADNYLLDDPLSAVDSHVGKHIFDKVIGPEGILKKKTRILVTHSILHLPKVDWVIVLADGTVKEQGTYEQLLELKGTFAELVKTYGKEEEAKAAAEVEGQGDHVTSRITSTGGIDITRNSYSRQASLAQSITSEDGMNSEPMSPRRKNILTRQISHLSQTSRVSQSEEIGVVSTVSNLTTVETMETGKVGWPVYWYYFRSIGFLMCTTSIFVTTCAWTAQAGSNIWMSYWSNDGPDKKYKTDMRLGVFGALGLTQVIFMYFGYMILGLGMFSASGRIHRNLLANILRLPLSFFDTTPVGRIVNRFSSDISTVDSNLPGTIIFLSELFIQAVLTIIIICVTTPLVAVVFVPLVVIYYIIQKFYIPTSRQLQRIGSTLRSPVYSHFSETITGLSTIRAYKLQDAFAAENRLRVDTNNKSIYHNYATERWLNMRLDFVGNLVTISTAIFAVMERHRLDPGTLGLIVMYAIDITFILNWIAQTTSYLETEIVAVERIKAYTEMETEAAWEIEDKKPADNWPNLGLITFDNYSTRYREGLDLVLKGIHCQVESREKIGIVGRTGAGKSSLTLALFRLIEASEGRIIIDGLDISDLGLADVRSRLTIIPQDPVLFCGSLRMNLDPFEAHSDQEIWVALEHSHLKGFVRGLATGLDHEIKEGGENLSVGQRQLVCLARALLRKTKILILDEATAAIDLETDDLIQETIRKEFADCTILTIAHRINTIMDSTRVMVLEKGSIEELDTPEALLSNQKSIFYSLAKEAGLA